MPAPPAMDKRRKSRHIQGMERVDIIIAGAGLGGSSMALALADQGWRVTLMDAAPPERLAQPLLSRAYALSAASLRLLRRLGLGEVITGAGAPMHEVRVREAGAVRADPVAALAFDETEIGEPLGALLEDRHMRAALMSAIEAHPLITLRAGCAITSLRVEAGRAAVQLASGAELAADLVIAADGAESRLRARAGIRVIKRDYDQAAVTCIIGHAAPHEGIAEQVFLPDGPLAVLPLCGQRCNIVWSMRREQADRFAAMAEDDFLLLLAERIGPRLGALSLETRRHATALSLSVATCLHGQRLALIGDAARRVHPIAGQGLNAGLRDVAVLAEHLARARARGQSPGDGMVLEAYSRARRPGSFALSLLTDGAYRMFTTGGSTARLARGLGMRALDHAAPLRSRMIREAAGLSGALPELMR